MKLLDYVKNVFGPIIEKNQVKRKEKMLIQTNDDKMVVDALPLDEDNSRIDIKSIVENMESPEEMAKVVENNMDEIIQQDNVKDILLHLKDDDIASILEQNKDEFRKEEKIRNAIEAIGNNEKKLRALFKNLTYITDIELSRILSTLRPEENAMSEQMIEQQKVKIVSMKILEHMIKHGGAWHLGELTTSLQENSKLCVLDLCLNTIKDYETDKKQNLGSRAKTKLVTDLLRVTNVESATKFKIIDKYVDNDLITLDEKAEIKLQMEKERLEIEENERQKKERAKGRGD